MRAIGIRCPDGTWLAINDRTEIGRGVRGLVDENASRIQFEVSPIPGAGEACLHLQAVGINREPPRLMCEALRWAAEPCKKAKLLWMLYDSKLVRSSRIHFHNDRLCFRMHE